MLSAVVVGHAVSTVKHPSMDGYKLLLCQVFGGDGKESGTPIVALDFLGAGIGQRVFVSTDGIGARTMLGDNTSPARMYIQGLIDETSD